MTDARQTVEMSPRERFVAALAHREGDRVPVDLGSTGGGITGAAYHRLCQHLGIECDPDLATSGTQLNEFDERVLERLGVDVRHIGVKSPARTKNVDGSETDEWGLTYRKEGFYWQIVNSPLRDATIADLASYPWPNPADPRRSEGLAARGRDLYQNTGYAISTRSIGSIFQLCCRMRGMDQFLVDMMIDKPFAHALMERSTELTIALYDVLLSAVGQYAQMVETQDDLGTQRAPFISPSLYQDLVQPYHARLAGFIKNKTRGRAAVFMHSDGSIFDLVPHIADAGIDVLNPCQPQAAKMEPWRLKDTFGARLTFHGGLDQQGVIPFGSVADVRDEVKAKLRVFAPGGGYLFAPCHNLQPDVPPENILAMFDAAKEFGVYPVQ
jgi:uroporphyrinogen decarboxylase